MKSKFSQTLALFAFVSLAGCEKKHGEAIVLETEHIAAQEIVDTPAPVESATPAAESADADADGTARPLAADEIVVDSYVMKADARGTGRDPRATKDEQWRVKVKTINDGRTFTAQTDRAHFEKLTPGDRVRVSYRVGKYTGTVWLSELD